MEAKFRNVKKNDRAVFPTGEQSINQKQRPQNKWNEIERCKLRGQNHDGYRKRAIYRFENNTGVF